MSVVFSIPPMCQRCVISHGPRVSGQHYKVRKDIEDVVVALLSYDSIGYIVYRYSYACECG